MLEGGAWAEAASGAAAGMLTTVLHCGQEARFPAALAGTFSARPQPEQWNSSVSVS